MTSRPTDMYGRVPACEAAAATATLIFDQVSPCVQRLNSIVLTQASSEFDG